MKYIKPIICCSSFYVLSQLLAYKAGQGGTPYLSAGVAEYAMAAVATLCGLHLAHRLACTRLLIALKVLMVVVLGCAVSLGTFAIAGRLELLGNLNLLAVAVVVSALVATGLDLLVSAAQLAKENLPPRTK